MNKAEKIKVLELARDRWIAHPTTKVIAANLRGEQVGASCPDAVCWCAMGSIIKEAEASVGFAYALNLYFEYNDVFQYVFGSNTSFVAANDSGALTVDHWNAVIERLAAE